ncbi:hypothetical protein L596_009551 [Steinernema carpocapsae]|uniref:Uncharacterized protein n=1 Tax=Steinernema carpocapsae TaxID=34508 RepID=A0A4U5PFQ2_STECR|nr:hypothetical protein L596_009551 [Steinernema carpocapsae]
MNGQSIIVPLLESIDRLTKSLKNVDSRLTLVEDSFSDFVESAKEKESKALDLLLTMSEKMKLMEKEIKELKSALAEKPKDDNATLIAGQKATPAVPDTIKGFTKEGSKLYAVPVEAAKTNDLSVFIIPSGSDSTDWICCASFNCHTFYCLVDFMRIFPDIDVERLVIADSCSHVPSDVYPPVSHHTLKKQVIPFLEMRVMRHAYELTLIAKSFPDIDLRRADFTVVYLSYQGEQSLNLLKQVIGSGKCANLCLEGRWPNVSYAPLESEHQSLSTLEMLPDLLKQPQLRFFEIESSLLPFTFVEPFVDSFMLGSVEVATIYFDAAHFESFKKFKPELQVMSNATDIEWDVTNENSKKRKRLLCLLWTDSDRHLPEYPTKFVDPVCKLEAIF